MNTLSSRSKTALAAILTSFFQLCFCLLQIQDLRLPQSYGRLAMWDSDWYEHIARLGYVSTVPPLKWQRDLANVAFFPGYPMLARTVGFVLGCDTRLALLLTAQLAAIFFWFYFYRTLLRSAVRLPIIILAAFFVIAHPAAFYLQAAYSESLFLASLLATLYFAIPCRHNERLNQWSFVLATLSGFVMTSARIVGAPLVFLPPLVCLLRRTRGQTWSLFSQLMIGAVLSLTGCLSFFAFCYFKWGAWDLYLQTQRIGWGIVPDYFAIFHRTLWWPLHAFVVTPELPTALTPVIPGLTQQPSGLTALPVIEALSLSRDATTIYLWALVLVLTAEAAIYFKKAAGFLQRAPYYGAALLMMYISASGLASIGLQSMIRYTFPVHVALTIAVAMLINDFAKDAGKAATNHSTSDSACDSGSRKQSVLSRMNFWLFALLVVVSSLYSLSIERALIQMFTNAQWVS